MVANIRCAHCDCECANQPIINKVVLTDIPGVWICPACHLCNTTVRLATGAFKTTLGYQREIEVVVEVTCT